MGGGGACPKAMCQGHVVTGIRFAALTPQRNRSNLFMRAADAARDQP
jgi:hypothetical protein